MGVLLGAFSPRRQSFRFDRWPIWYELLFISAILTYFAASSTILDFPLCPFRYFYGHCCPTCGTTRSVWATLHGNFTTAWKFNPLGFIVVIALFRRLATLLLPGSRWIQAANADPPSLLLLAAFFALGYARWFHVL